jgi:transposase
MNLILLKVGFLKGMQHRISTPKKRESLTFFGALNMITKKFYWKKSDKSDSEQFIWFLTQLRQKTMKKEVVIILDNASIHNSKAVKAYCKHHSNINLFYLPSYSPEYNPVELFWKWIKPKLYGFSAIGGIKTLLKKFRKYVWLYNKNKLINPINFKFKTYNVLL